MNNILYKLIKLLILTILSRVKVLFLSPLFLIYI